MARAKTKLILGAYHAHGLHSAYLGFLYFYFLVTVIESRADSSDNHSLAGRHIRGAADDLLRLLASEIDSCHMQMIGIGMVGTGQHLADDYPPQTSADALNLLDSVTFKAHRRQDGGQLFRT